MDILDFIPATINTIPSKKIEGRKRLQKIVHLLELAGADVEGNFDLLHYGPYSKKVSNAIEELEFLGMIKESVQAIGVYDTLQYVYEIGDLFEANKSVNELTEQIDKRLLENFEDYSTVDLEVASTIGFFESQGSKRDQAKERTKEIKPKKMIPTVIQKAEEILSFVSSSRQGRALDPQNV